jgi:glucose/arabinose dehydrogenase
MSQDSWTRRQLLRSGAAVAGSAGLVGAATARTAPGSSAQEAIVGGYAIREFAPVRLPAGMTVGPDGDLYVTSLSSSGYEDLVLPENLADVVKDLTRGNATVERVELTYTPGGPVAMNLTTVVDGLEFPLGVAFDDDGALYVTDNRLGIEGRSREKATVYRVAAVDGSGEKEPVIDGLPSGPIHDANHIEFGPEGRMHIALGSTSCNGKNHDVEIHPYTGSILRVEVDDVVDDPAVLHWVDETGDPIESAAPDWDNVNRRIAQHTRNEAFNDTVEVVARGFRNIFGLAFGPDDVPHTGMNGSQIPASQDVFYRLDEIGETDVADGDASRRLGQFAGVPHYGFPYALNFVAGDGDGVGRNTSEFGLEPNPTYDDDPVDIDPTDYADAEGLMGWHVCATGLDFPTEGQFAFPAEYHTDAYIAECGPYEAQTTVDRTMASGDTANTGRKVTRVNLADDGSVEGYQDWLTGFSSPTDVQFGPEGELYIADLDNGIFVAQPTIDGAVPAAR